MSANKLNWARHTAIDNPQDLFGLSDSAVEILHAPELISFKTLSGEPRQIMKGVVIQSDADEAVITRKFVQLPAGSQIILANDSADAGLYIKTSDGADDTKWKVIKATV